MTPMQEHQPGMVFQLRTGALLVAQTFPDGVYGLVLGGTKPQKAPPEVPPGQADQPHWEAVSWADLEGYIGQAPLPLVLLGNFPPPEKQVTETMPIVGPEEPVVVAVLDEPPAEVLAELPPDPSPAEHHSSHARKGGHRKHNA